jgi:hypothetical protein
VINATLVISAMMPFVSVFRRLVLEQCQEKWIPVFPSDIASTQ